MGGFDSQSIKKEFGIPKRYDVCCTIAVGYADDTSAEITTKNTKWNFHYYLVCKKQAYH